MRAAIFDRVVIAEMAIKMTPPNKVEATGVFVNSQNGQNHGWTKATTWSKATIDLVKQLAESMAADLETMHFSDTAIPSTTTAGTGGTNEPQGLGTFLRNEDDDVPQG